MRGVTASVLTTAGGRLPVGIGELDRGDDASGYRESEQRDQSHGHQHPVAGTSANQGTDAVFHLNGILVDQPSNVVNNVIQGMSFNILDSSTTPVTLSLASDPAQLSSALQNVVTDYNSLRTALNAQEGPSAGALSGDSSITQLEDAMRRFTGYTNSSGSIQSLSDLGITFASNGQATLDPTVVSGFTDAQLSAAFSFIGSATSGMVGASQSFQRSSAIRPTAC